MKKEGWESLLNAYLAKAASASFVWGKNDCALWAASWILLATGKDFVSVWRDKYTSEETLRPLMAERGFASIEAIADATGLTRIAVAYAQRGDLVLQPNGPLGICDGRMSHFLMEKGVTSIPTLMCAACWRVE